MGANTTAPGLGLGLGVRAVAETVNQAVNTTVAGLAATATAVGCNGSGNENFADRSRLYGVFFCGCILTGNMYMHTFLQYEMNPKRHASFISWQRGFLFTESRDWQAKKRQNQKKTPWVRVGHFL